MNTVINKKRKILNAVLSANSLSELDDDTFIEGWKAFAFLYPGLHPDDFDAENSGWTEDLIPLAKEAFRRYDLGLIGDEEMYCYEEAKKGILTSTDGNP